MKEFYDFNLTRANERTIEMYDLTMRLKKEIFKLVVGQEYMIDRILIGLFTGGHILIEGLPGLAKSSTVNILSKVVGITFKRIQFTPDLLPADILGSVIYYQETGEFITKKGPIFSNIVLADEINRAPAKVQSALLEAMQEKQVTISGHSYRLSTPFIVLATQNPIEHEGTYPLPEAQQDRFMMKLKVHYPAREDELEILNRFTDPNRANKLSIERVISKTEIFDIKTIIRNVHLDERLKDYIVNLVFATREKSSSISYGVSPRGTLALVNAAKGRAFLDRRNYVTPDDIKAVVYDVFRHRLVLSYEAEAENITADNIISEILDKVKVP